MKFGAQGAFAIMLLYGVVHLTFSSKDPYRWILSRGKPAIQSSTEGSHVASYATDGDYNNYDLPISYSQTTVSDDPYLQVDLGKTVSVDFVILNFPMLKVPPKIYGSIRILLGQTSSLSDPSTVSFNGPHDRHKYTLIHCFRWGRYLTVQSKRNAVELSVVEVAVHRRPIESLAYRKPAQHSSSYGGHYVAALTTDMNFKTYFISNRKKDNWVKVDLGDVYFVYEVFFWGRSDCCTRPQTNLEVRAGRSLDGLGNSNHWCGNATLYTLEIRSYYCDVIGRYINLIRRVESGFLEIGEIVVNPEKTENVALFPINAAANVLTFTNNYVRHLTDGDLSNCHVMKETLVKKKVWIKMQKTSMVSRVFIVNNPYKLDELTDFDIAIGPSTSENTLCLPGLQNMAGIHSASFFCEPRVSGQVIIISQHREDKQMSICEIGVFEESEPKIDRKKDLYVWKEENKDLTLTCDAKGYPAPVVTWVKDNEVLLSGSNTLDLTALGRNQSGEYECWANNTHGVDVKIVDVVISSHLRICSEFLELNYELGKSEKNEIQIKGNLFYSVYDPKGRKYLQFQELAPKKSSLCQAWLNGKHPKLQDGVVARTLCVKNETHDCSTTHDIYIRKCAASYIYNFKDLTSSYGLELCLKNAPNSGFNPSMASPVTNHALSNTVFQTELEVKESYQCLMMCQLDKRCKSFNFSKKFKVCELNTATKKEYAENYGYRADYSYYHMSSGMVVNVKDDL